MKKTIRIITEEQRDFIVNYDCLLGPELYGDEWIVVLDEDFAFEGMYEFLLDCPTLDYQVYLYSKGE